jgi:DNA-binding transcriptional ArsR family regulator
MPAIRKHLKVLEDAELIVRRRNGRWRPRHIEAAPLHQVADWVERYRQFRERDFDRPREYLPELEASEAVRKFR